MIRETFAYRMIRSQSTFPFIILRLLYIIDSGAYFIFSSASPGSAEGTKKASDSTLQADAEDSCNNETESPNVPEDPKKKESFFPGSFASRKARMNLKQLKNPNPQILS